MGREAGDTAGHAKATLQDEAMITEVTAVPMAALQAPLRAGCAFVFYMICKISLATFLNALGFQEKKWFFTACTLVGTLALETVAVTALAEAGVPVVCW